MLNPIIRKEVLMTLRTSSAAAPHVAGPDAPRPLQQGTPKFMAPS